VEKSENDEDHGKLDRERKGATWPSHGEAQRGDVEAATTREAHSSGKTGGRVWLSL